MFTFTVPPMSDVPSSPTGQNYTVYIPHLSLEPAFILNTWLVPLCWDGEVAQSYDMRWQLCDPDGHPFQVWSPGRARSMSGRWARIMLDDVMEHVEHGRVDLPENPVGAQWMDIDDALHRFAQVVERLGGSSASVDYWGDVLFGNSSRYDVEQLFQVSEIPAEVRFDEIRGLDGGPWVVTFRIKGETAPPAGLVTLNEVGFLTLAEARVDGLAVVITRDQTYVIDRAVVDGYLTGPSPAGIRTIPALPTPASTQFKDESRALRWWSRVWKSLKRPADISGLEVDG